MKKKDRRSLYTENIIKETVLRLMQTKSINKITVSEVCKISEINRGTFYLHYRDCFDVLEQLQDAYCDKVIDFLEKNKESSHLDIILNLHEINQANKDDYLIFTRTDLPMRSFKKLTDYGKKRIIDEICSNSSLTVEQAEWVAHYMISASIGMTQRYEFDKEHNAQREVVTQQFIMGGLKTIYENNSKS